MGAEAGTCSKPVGAPGAGADRTEAAGTIQQIAANKDKRKRAIDKHSFRGKFRRAARRNNDSI
jgi:hypothetical protein